MTYREALNATPGSWHPRPREGSKPSFRQSLTPSTTQFSLSRCREYAAYREEIDLIERFKARQPEEDLFLDSSKIYIGKLALTYLSGAEQLAFG